jgi:hypothetical protein
MHFSQLLMRDRGLKHRERFAAHVQGLPEKRVHDGVQYLCLYLLRTWLAVAEYFPSDQISGRESVDSLIREAGVSLKASLGGE